MNSVNVNGWYICIFYFMLFILIPIVGVFNSTLSVFLACITLVFVFKFDYLLVAAIITFSSYNGIFYMAGDSPLRYFVEPLSLLLLIVHILYFRISKVKYSLVLLLSVLFLIYSLLFSLLRAYDKNSLYLLFFTKDYVIPSLICISFFVVINVTNWNEDKTKFVIKSLVISVLAAGTISLINYFFDISNYPRFVTVGGEAGTVSYRGFGSIQIPRMKSIFGFSTEGAASVLYACAMWGVIKLKIGNIITRGIFLLILLLSAVASVSFTFVFSIFLLLLIGWFLKGNVALTAILSCILISFIPFINLSVDNGTRIINIVEYGYNSFLRTKIIEYLNFDFVNLTFGIGYIPKGYLSSDYHGLILDNWIISMLNQMGIVGIVIFITLIVVLLLNGLNLNKKLWVYIPTIMFFGYLGFAHGAFLIDRLFMVKSYFLLAIINFSTVSYLKTKENLSSCTKVVERSL